MAGLYIHIPFCKQACHYCDFHFSTNRSLQKEICEAIGDELALQKNYLSSETVETIYFGGGTPSLLEAHDLENIFQSVYKHFSVAPSAEITLEANPDDLTHEKLQLLKTFGANRLSVGVQSFDSTVLKFLNRSHNSLQAEIAIENARNAGFININVDLIYAIPARDSNSLASDIQKLLSLSPEHISAYSLTVEEKTALGKWHAAKKFTPAPDEENASQFEIIADTLLKAGFEHYEISNYAKSGFISQHNSNYWKQKKYLGVGPSAHSFNGRDRQANVSNNYTYLKSIRSQAIPATAEKLSREDHINEYLMTSLRTQWGCSFTYLLHNHQYDLFRSQHAYIKTCIDDGLMITEGDTIFLTRTGKMHADKITSDLFLIE